MNMESNFGGIIKINNLKINLNYCKFLFKPS